MAQRKVQASAPAVLAGIYKAAGGGVDGYMPIDQALQWVRHLWPQAESYLPELESSGYIRLSRAGDYLTLTEAGKCFVESLSS